MITGSAIEPGDPVIGLPSSGLHSNGYTLARRALEGIPLDDRRRLGRPLGEALLEPTEIYVKPVLELLDSDVEVRGLAHITSGGLDNLLRLEAEVGYEIDAPLPVPAALRADPGARRGLRRRDARGLQHGLRVLRRRPETRRSSERCELISVHYPALGPDRRRHGGRGQGRPRLGARRPRRRLLQDRGHPLGLAADVVLGGGTARGRVGRSEGRRPAERVGQRLEVAGIDEDARLRS